MARINEIGDTEKGQYMLGRLRARKFKREGFQKGNEIGKYAEKAREKSTQKNKNVDGVDHIVYSPGKYDKLTNAHANGWHDEIKKNENRKRSMKLTESYISNVVRNVINEMFNEISSIPYDPNMLDGIDSIDARSINLFIQSMIPEGNRVSVNSPYKAIRQLVLYFSGEGASMHGGRLTKDIVGMMLKNKTLSSIIYAITQEDKKIIDLIYGQNRLSGKPLMQQIVWHLDEITAQLGKFNEAMNSANFRNYFSNTEAMEGSADGKRVGLAKILIKAYMGTNEIKNQIKKMEALLSKQADPFSYNTGRFRR